MLTLIFQFFNGLAGVVGPYAQDNIVSIEKSPKELRLYNLGTHLVKNMVTVDGQAAALSSDNAGSWGGIIAAYIPFA
jgi:glucan 1,3-beta-glucosidase